MMIYGKISFLIVLMMSIVCFSVDNFGGEEYYRRLIAKDLKEARLSAIEKCLSAMMTTFNCDRSKIICIRNAFLSMKLYGDHAFVYNHGVRKYYESLYLYVDYAKIQIPSEYCGLNQSCLDQILVFQDTPIHEVHEILTPSTVDLTSDERELVENAMSYARFLRGESSSLIIEPNSEPNVTLNETNSGTLETFTHEPAPSSSKGTVDLTLDEKKLVENAISYARFFRGESSSLRESSSIDIKKRNVMMNALYYHVIFDRRKECQPPEGAARKYFHEAGSHGFRYLAAIARSVELNPSTADNLVSPTQYCHDLYK